MTALDNAPTIGPYDIRWPCRDCGNPQSTHTAVRPLSARHVWLCRKCAEDDARHGIPVFRVVFESEIYEYIFHFLSWLEAEPTRYVIVAGRRVFDAADLIEVLR